VQPVPVAVSPIVDPREKAMDLLVNDMGFPTAAVKDALASCEGEAEFDLDTVIAMLVSANNTPPAVKATVKLVQPTELDGSSPVQAGQIKTRRPSHDARRLVRKKQEKSGYLAQTKLADFVERRRSGDKDAHAQRRSSKIKAFQVLGVSQERRVESWVR
jgi:hypothetical protein